MADFILKLEAFDKGVFYEKLLGDTSEFKDTWQGTTIEDEIILPWYDENLLSDVRYIRLVFENSDNIIGGHGSVYPSNPKYNKDFNFYVNIYSSSSEESSYQSINTTNIYPYDAFDIPQKLEVNGYNLDGGSYHIYFNNVKCKDNLKVNISCSTENSSIYYTLDNSEPNESSNLYESDLNLKIGNYLKCKAYKEGYDESNLSSEEIDLIQLPYPKTTSDGTSATNILINNWNEYPENTYIRYATDHNDGEQTSPLNPFYLLNGNTPIEKDKQITYDFNWATGSNFYLQAYCNGYKRSNLISSINADGKTNLREFDCLTGKLIT